MSAHKRKAKGKSHDDQEKVVLVTTMALPTFQIVGGSGPHIFFRKAEFGADMMEELGYSYMDHHINIAPWHRERKHESTNRSIN